MSRFPDVCPGFRSVTAGGCGPDQTRRPGLIVSTAYPGAQGTSLTRGAQPRLPVVAGYEFDSLVWAQERIGGDAEASGF
jgi:hypothetical protein